MPADPVLPLIDAVEDRIASVRIGKLHRDGGRGTTSALAGGRWWLLYVHSGRCRIALGTTEIMLGPGELVVLGTVVAARLVDAVGRGFQALRLGLDIPGVVPKEMLIRRRRAPHVAGVLTDLAATRGDNGPSAARLRRCILGYLLELVRGCDGVRSHDGIRPFSADELSILHGTVRANDRRWDGARLARLLDCSIVHLRRRFRATWGVSPRDWLLSRRLRWGAERLRATRLPVATIADELGYADQALFSRQFTAFFGVSPRVYRTDGGSNWLDLRAWGAAKRARWPHPPGGAGGGAR